MADTKKRVRRTAEEIAQDFDAKIAYHEKCIESLKVKKEQALRKIPLKLWSRKHRNRVCLLRKSLRSWA